MNNYQNSKKARYVAAVVYLIIFAFVMTGTYFSEQQKAASKNQSQSKDLLKLVE
jgi:hypothetical protein